MKQKHMKGRKIRNAEITKQCAIRKRNFNAYFVNLSWYQPDTDVASSFFISQVKGPHFEANPILFIFSININVFYAPLSFPILLFTRFVSVSFSFPF